ncbi:5,10-methylenetetrahydrofolate reductase [Drosophila mauritiana]|uniref:5,10-methylenetetrahydrofolate reductase n=1 Tax=Drosophila mauritiana TaxID=7226 RepID=A0A6P8K2X3_DROMA|nr:5,10-methylenetetrahydrofolate reductase [Drosophila mauritiana]
MHAIQVPAGGSSPAAASYIPCVTFAPDQNETSVTEQRIGTLVAERTAQRRLFYGIEVMASDPSGRPTCLDFNHFLPLLPTFVSVVWLSQRYWDVQPVGQVESLHLAHHLATRIPVLPHVSAYRMSRQRLDQILALNFSSLLAVRGDQVHEDQDFSISYPMVEHSRRQRGETISVCVGGYPEGYTSLGDIPQNSAKNMEFLKAKIDAGADCIITQICYRPEVIVQFVKDCRAAGIAVPIVVGLMSHESFRSYSMIEQIAGVHLPDDLREQLDHLHSAHMMDMKSDQDLIRRFFVSLTVRTVRHVLDADVGIWGFHFFTLNRFKSVQAVLQELRDLDLLKDAEKDTKGYEK